jgi:hypothetical protein
MAMTRSVLQACTLGALMLAAMPLAAQTIYKCVDATGGTLISNTRVDKNCRPIVTSPENTLPAPPRAAARPAGAPPASATPTPAGFPRVQEDTQRARDSDRRHILEQELAGEQRSLDQARRDLADLEGQRAAADRLQPYRERIAQHERNLQAIQKELGNLR